MALKDFFKGSITIPKYIPSFFVSPTVKIEEQFKGIVPRIEVRFPKELGEQHPFDYVILEGVYKEVGLVTGVVDKIVDFIVGPGFYVSAEDERAQKIIEDFMEDTNFDTLLRAWIKEALIKGTGYLELGGNRNEVPTGLKVLNANWMYVKRDILGVVEGYNQYIGRWYQFSKDKINMAKVTFFEPYQIAHLSINKVGDSEYGIGIVYPAITTLNRLLSNEKEMQTLLKRKANAPIHAKLGNKEKGLMPTAEDVEAFGKKLEYMNNKHEWATDALVEMNVLSFGPLAEKFSFVLEHDLDMLFFTFQIPEVLMGRGSIPEGLASVQMDAFERRIGSFQAEIEKIIEQEIFRRVLRANGLDEHVEFVWGSPSNTEKKERLLTIHNYLQLGFQLSPTFVKMLEQEAAMLLGFDEKKLETAEEERKKELVRKNPLVPGQNQEKLKIEVKEVIQENFQDIISQSQPYTIQEWLGFSYIEYQKQIQHFLSIYTFDQLLASTNDELKAGKLTTIQVEKLRDILQDGFLKNKTLLEIGEEIKKELGLKDLYRTQNGEMLLKDDQPILSLSAEYRPMMIARSEVTRAGAEGAILHYKEEGVERYRWVSSLGQRTCEICGELNGQVFEIDNGPLPGDPHPLCRCTVIAIAGENIKPVGGIYGFGRK